MADYDYLLLTEHSDTKSSYENCTSTFLKPITKFFLFHFGNDTIPDGYWDGDDYGSKYKDQDFAELFPIFYILFVMAVLCLLALLLMILMLVWLHKRRYMEREHCNFLNKLALLTLILLLLLVIFMAFPLYMTLKSSFDLKGQGNSDKSSHTSQRQTELDRRITHISGQVDKLLISDFTDMKNDVLAKYKESRDPPERDLHNIIKARESAQENYEKFIAFLIEYIEGDFDRVLYYDDAYRIFSRNISAYVMTSPTGENLGLQDKLTMYFNYIHSLEKWAHLWQTANAVTKLMQYYGNVRVKSLSARNERTEIYKRLKSVLEERELDAKLLSDEIKYLLQAQTRKNDKNTNVVIIIDFAIIMCYIAIVVLLIYLIILLCGVCRKRNRNRAMVKPFTFIYIILTLLFEVMAFVFFFPFFYGVIDYNEVCNETKIQQTEKSFYSLMLSQCTDDEKVYTIMADNKLVKHPISEWKPLAISNMKTACNKDCSPLNLDFIHDNLRNAKDFPNKKYCRLHMPPDSVKVWRQQLNKDITSFISPGYMHRTMGVGFPDESYYTPKINRTKCVLDYVSKIEKNPITDMYPPYNDAQNKQCMDGYKMGIDFINLVNSSVDDVNAQCQKVNDDCISYVDEASKIEHAVNAYNTNAERKLGEEIGPCKSISDLLKERRNEYCNCDLYMLNGIWVGSFLFLLALFISLMLLSCLICIFKRCENNDRPPRSSTQRTRRGETGPRRQLNQSDSIVLPPVALPRAAIKMMKANPNAQVRYLVKKKTR